MELLLPSIDEGRSMRKLSRSRNSAWAYPPREWDPEGARHPHFWKASTRKVKILRPGWLLLSPASRNPPAWTTGPLALWQRPSHSALLVLRALKTAGGALEPYSGRQGSRSTSSRRRPRALPRSTRGSHLHLGFCWGKGDTGNLSIMLSQLADCFSVLPKRNASASVIFHNWYIPPCHLLW